MPDNQLNNHNTDQQPSANPEQQTHKLSLFNKIVAAVGLASALAIPSSEAINNNEADKIELASPEDTKNHKAGSSVSASPSETTTSTTQNSVTPETTTTTLAERIMSNNNNVSKPKNTNDSAAKPDVPKNFTDPTSKEEQEKRPKVDVKTKTPEQLAEDFMRRDTVYITSIGCSGDLVWKDGRAIGISSALHCFKPLDNQPKIEAEGRDYVLQPSPYKAQTGDTASRLKTAGELETFYFPNDPSSDLAFAAFKGEDINEVSASYRTLSEQQIRALKMGDTVYMSGWPGEQGNNHGELKRQEFTMSVLGVEDAQPVAGGKNIKVLWTAANSTPDGAECTFGASGAEGFVVINGQKRSVGTLATFDAIRPGVPGRTLEEINNNLAYYSWKFGVNFGPEITHICGFSFEVDNNGRILKSVSNLNQIPGYQETTTTTPPETTTTTTTTIPPETTTTTTPPETTTTTTPPEKQPNPDSAVMSAAKKNFADPSQERIVVDGRIIVGVDSATGNQVMVDRFYAYVDRQTGKTVVGYYDEGAPFGVLFVEYPDARQLKVFDRDSDQSIDFYTATGDITASNGRLEDKNNLVFGSKVSVPINQLGVDKPLHQVLNIPLD